MKKIFAFLVSAVAVLCLTVLPAAALAQSGGVQGGLTSIQGSFPGSGTQARTVPQLIQYVINIMLFFAGLIAVLFIIIGGYWYITSAGNEEQAEKGKNALVNALIGVVLIILSWVIVNSVVNLVSGGSIFGF